MSLQSISRDIADEYGAGGHGEINHSILLVARALVKIAESLQFFQDEIINERKRWRDEEELAIKEDREREPQR